MDVIAIAQRDNFTATIEFSTFVAKYGAIIVTAPGAITTIVTKFILIIGG